MQNLQLNKAIKKETSLKGQYWDFQQCSEEDIQKVVSTYKLPDLVARLLVLKKIDFDDIQNFLDPKLKNTLPNPSQLKDMDLAVERVIQQISQQKSIGIIGDYDVDGATSSSLLARFMDAINMNCDIYIPDRLEEGYGPSEQAFDHFQKQNIDLVITVDCGTTAFETLSYAKSIGIDVIVIDHHISDQTFPEACAIINPNRIDEDKKNIPLQTLAAVGVCFLFLVALHRQLKSMDWYNQQSLHEPDLRYFLDLVALGTVCDVVKLKGLNRVYVSQGLKILNQRKNVGIEQLIRVSRLHEKIVSHHLGFMLGPRVNAGGRVGQSSYGSTLLRTENASLAQSLAEQLEKYNRERQEIEKTILEEAMQMAEEQSQSSSVLIIAKEGWHPGVIGIVSSRIKEKYNRPTFVIALNNGVGKGSGRSVTGFDLGQAVIQAKHDGILVAGGGHSMAAGLTIEENLLEALHLFLNQKFDETFAGEYDFTPTVTIDAAIALSAVHPELLYQLEKLQPFGMGNAEPKFLLPQCLVQHAQIVGEKHLKLTLSDPQGHQLQAIAFGVCGTQLGDALQNAHQPLDFVGTLKFNHWQGKSTPQLTLIDAKYSK